MSPFIYSEEAHFDLPNSSQHFSHFSLENSIEVALSDSISEYDDYLGRGLVIRGEVLNGLLKPQMNRVHHLHILFRLPVVRVVLSHISVDTCTEPYHGSFVLVRHIIPHHHCFSFLEFRRKSQFIEIMSKLSINLIQDLLADLRKLVPF